MKRQTPEADLQRNVCTFLRYAAPLDVFVTAIPGGDRQQTRTPGYVAGTPDILLIHDGKAFMIELKSAKGRVSEAQERCHLDLASAGVRVGTCRSLTDVANFLKACGVPLLRSVVQVAA